MSLRITSRAAGLAAAALIALAAVAGCTSSGSSGASAARSALASNPTASAALAKAKADVQRCITGTPLDQWHTVKLLLFTPADGDKSAEVKATRTRVGTCMGVPPAQRTNFYNEAIKKAEAAHLIAHPVKNGQTYLLVTLPALLDKYQHLPTGVGTGQPSVPGTTPKATPSATGSTP